MNEEQLRDLIMIMVGISIAMVLVTVTVTIMMNIENTSENTLEITELERNYGYCMDTLKDVLPENLPENFDEEKVLGCGVITKLGMDNKCYRLPQM